ncbi:hypothetical protein QQ008_18020 [Fulvivirgaceae bacterium BMA10]|uniref:Uncharacterized protein n=1 Tax=Splendidivirga corallicola TaxID=3051826 RepID=A0ABT8KRE6_9BACT|nr:hypothetical protein [Fulvivirgaceae bacterium BMA10]
MTEWYPEYKKLKLILSEFLIYEEVKCGIDKRYDTFFAAILNKNSTGKLSIPENLRILSWNYDRQIEFSIGQFQKIHEHSDKIADLIQLYPRKNSETYNGGFAVFKLNGSVGGITKKNQFIPLSYNTKEIGSKLNSDTLDRLITQTLLRYEDIQFPDSYIEDILINYSWEYENEVVNQTREQALIATKETTDLIVIGYSFPTFNRKLDSEILNNMENLETVYVQSPKESIDGVVQRLKALSNKAIEPIRNDDVEEFYIPFDFD